MPLTSFIFMMPRPATQAQLDAAARYGLEKIYEMKEKTYLYKKPGDEPHMTAKDYAYKLFEAVGGIYEGSIAYVEGVHPEVLVFLKAMVQKYKGTIIEKL